MKTILAFSATLLLLAALASSSLAGAQQELPPVNPFRGLGDSSPSPTPKPGPKPSPQFNCTFTQRAILPYDHAAFCVQSKPFDRDTFDRAMKLLDQTLPGYAFVDIVMEVPEGNPDIPQKVDLYGAIKDIKKRADTFKTEYEWMTELENVFNQLNDAHTMFYKLGSYKDFSFWQPFLLVSFVDPEGTQRVGIAPQIFPFLEQVFSQLIPEFRDLLAGVVLEIDGEEPVQHIIDYADTQIGESHDLGTRFMIALTTFHMSDEHPGDGVADNAAMPGLFSFRPMGKVPAKPTVTYKIMTLAGQVREIEIPWVSMVNPPKPTNPFGGEAEEGSTSTHLCTQKHRYAHDEPVTLVPCSEQALPGALNSARTVFPWQAPVLPTVRFAPKPSPSASTALQAHNFFGDGKHDHTWLLITARDSNNVQFYANTKDSRVGIMVLLTFSPNDQVEFLEGLESGLYTFRRMGITKLIIDLRDNGGGIVCDGFALLKYFFPEMDPYDGYDMKHSPINDKLVKASSEPDAPYTAWSGNFKMWDSRKPVNGSEWYFPGEEITRGGRTSKYSKLVHLDCDPVFESFMHDHEVTPEVATYKPSDILLLSYGFCGSTCAMFARHMQVVNRVRTVVAGGIKGRPQTFTSFPGGAVIDSKAVVQTAIQLGLDDFDMMDLMAPFTFRYTYLEVYHQDHREVPSEYDTVLANHRVDLSFMSAINPQKVWDSVVPIFDQKP